MKLTEQQQAAVACDEDVFIIKACAGSGKTSVLIKYAELRPRQRMTYLAFNRAIKEEAERKFPSNVKCVTTHGMAYAKFGRFYREKLNTVKPYHLTSALGIPMMTAGRILDAINAFLCSADSEISEGCFERKVGEGSADLVELAKKAWKLMQDTANKEVPMSHDGYLKLFQLSGAQIDCDVILFDEFQDSNEVTQAIVDAQRCKKVYVGDSRQSIYAFRGATNSMEKAAVKNQLSLTNSFRFGDGVAAFANAVLGEHQEHTDIISGLGQHKTTFEVDRRYPHTVLCRTNGMLFMEAVKAMKSGLPFGFVGGVKNYKFDNILDAYWLKKNKKSSIKDKFIQSFVDFDEMLAYAENLDDRELRFLGRVVKEYGSAIPDLVADIQSKAIDELTGNEIVMTTGHRSKGLEWMDVVITDDFTDMLEKFDPIEKKEVAPDIQEINLLYVVATRAQRGLKLPEMLVDWLSKSHPKLAKKVRSRDVAANTDLPMLGESKPAKSVKTEAKGKDNEESKSAETFRKGVTDLFGKPRAGETAFFHNVPSLKDMTRTKLIKELEAIAEQFADEAASCEKGNPGRARQLALSSGVIGAVLDGFFVTK